MRRFRAQLDCTNSLVFLGVILFLFSDFFRISFFQRMNLDSLPYLKNINIIGLIIILTLIIQRKGILLINKKTFLIFVFVTCGFLSFINGGSQIYLMPLYICNLLVPLLLLNCKFKVKDGLLLFRYFLIFYNVWVVLLIILGLSDYILDGKINGWLTQNFYSDSMAKLANSQYSTTYRLSSPWGPSLFNGFLILVFLILNSVYYSIFQKKNVKLYLVYIITFIGVILVGSKACFSLCFLYIVITKISGKNKLFNLAIIMLLFFVMFNSEFFQDNIWGRVIGQYETGTLSSGRNDILSFVTSGHISFPNIFIGNGAGFSRLLSTKLQGLYNTTNNFEYPAIMFSYDYGIFPTILYYLLIFGLPLYRLIRSYKILAISLITLFVYLNTFNGLADVFYDFNYKYIFLIIIFNSIVNASKDKEEITKRA
ncbi:hypothetical protein [Priestia megaterium]|uniref:hypothetical protein n=1 Tax=Priestia megaterium TaxID=1404 RepID=UPI0011A20ECA|nr:hypothetical protein [Priestia megaterium]